MTKTVLIPGILCALLFLIAGTSSFAQTSEIQKLQEELVQIQEILDWDCNHPTADPKCVGEEDLQFLIEQRDLLVEQIQQLTGLVTTAGNNGLTEAEPDDNLNPTEAPSHSPPNPVVAETYSRLLVNAETALKDLRQDPDANAQRIRIVEARIAGIKDKLNQD